METICLSASDRARIDALKDTLERFYQDNKNDALVSCTEAARLLGKSTVTISRMIKEGRLNKTTIGGSTGIRLSEIRDIKAQ